jgi:hypothetical protein
MLPWAGTGQPFVRCPKLNVKPAAFFAFGSPIGTVPLFQLLLFIDISVGAVFLGWMMFKYICGWVTFVHLFCFKPFDHC